MGWWRSFCSSSAAHCATTNGFCRGMSSLHTPMQSLCQTKWPYSFISGERKLWHVFGSSPRSGMPSPCRKGVVLGSVGRAFCSILEFQMALMSLSPSAEQSTPGLSIHAMAGDLSCLPRAPCPTHDIAAQNSRHSSASLSPSWAGAAVCAGRPTTARLLAISRTALPKHAWIGSSRH